MGRWNIEIWAARACACRWSVWAAIILAVLLQVFLNGPVAAAEVAADKAKAGVPLHQRIDQVVAAGNIVPVAMRAGDAEYVRRIYLDLTGSIPTVEETRRFLTDGAADKRIKLVDSLIRPVISLEISQSRRI